MGTSPWTAVERNRRCESLSMDAPSALEDGETCEADRAASEYEHLSRDNASACLVHPRALTMTHKRTLLLMMVLTLAGVGCIDLPEIDPGEVPSPSLDAGDELPDAGSPDAGQLDGGNTLCGNGRIDGDQHEVCDDTNTVSGDGCSADCHSDETCGNGIRDIAKDEACDDGNVVTETECPYGMASCTRCNAACTGELALQGPYCGDIILNGSEVCDDGNSVTETQCPYGEPACRRCNASCSAVLDLTGPYCGDSVQNGAETCDDGNTVTETQCPYGTAACTQCSSDCGNQLTLTGPYCGDSIQNGPEACDDGNTSVCGSCSATCAQVQLAKASGAITVVSSAAIQDGDTLTISDGIHPSVTFEFDRNNDGTQGEVIFWPTNPSLLSLEIKIAINNSGLNVIAQSSGNAVTLSNSQFGEFGNQPVTTTVPSSGLTVSGMSGGAGANCPSGTGCTRNEDCGPGLVCRADKRCGVP
jgi:cysteine-rich repeat protein